MAPLDRKDIEKMDFPTARRGYAPDAVDAHLRAVADAVEKLREEQAAAARPPTVASGASEQVRQIVEAAESTAAEIKAGAEREARAMRDEASAEGREHVARVSTASAGVIARLQEMDAELARLAEGLASQLGTGDAEVAAARARVAREAEPEADDEDEDDVAAHAVDAGAGPEPAAEPEPEPVAAEEPEPAGEEAEPEPKPDDESTGARLIALNMALNGSPRDETDRYLSENFELDDRKALLDEVYARVTG